MSAGPHVLTPAYYMRLYELEQEHGWCRGMRTLAGALLEPLFHGRTNRRILDAGCGTGSMLSWLQRFHGATVIGIDLSCHALAFCRRRGHRALAQCSVLLLPFRAQSFDLVVCADVLQHLPDPPGDAAALAELYRVLRPGGSLYIRTNSSFGMGAPLEGAAANYRRYTRASLCERVLATGFVIERATYANSLPSLLAVARRRLRRHTPLSHVGDPGLRVRLRPRALRWVDDVLALLLRAEAHYLRHRGRSLPFGHSVLVLARRPEGVTA